MKQILFCAKHSKPSYLLTKGRSYKIILMYQFMAATACAAILLCEECKACYRKSISPEAEIGGEEVVQLGIRSAAQLKRETIQL